MIYLDNAATTRISEQAFHAMILAMHDTWGNPSSLHRAGTEARTKVDMAREQIANSIGAKASEIIFTSGGSESDNLALRGLAPYLKQNGKTTIITSEIEHHAVLNTCKALEDDGFHVIYMPVDEDCRVDIEELDRCMNYYKDTLGLVSIMTVNNEVGSIQLIDDIGDLCQEYNVLFMTDAVQAFGHIPLNVTESHIDLMAMSGHKIHAMNGIGALYVREDLPLTAIITGGGQEKGLRSGTENVPGIVSMGAAAEFMTKNLAEQQSMFKGMRKIFLECLDIYGVKYTVNGLGVPNIISLTLPNCESEAMLLLLNERGICVSAGSACTAGSLEPSYVLRAMHLSDHDASCTIRISMAIDTSIDDMKKVAWAIYECTQQLRDMT